MTDLALPLFVWAGALGQPVEACVRVLQTMHGLTVLALPVKNQVNRSVSSLDHNWLLEAI